MTTPPRRSTRTRKTNLKYADQGWDESTLRLLRESAESLGSSQDSADSQVVPHEHNLPASPQALSDDEDYIVGNANSPASKGSLSSSSEREFGTSPATRSSPNDQVDDSTSVSKLSDDDLVRIHSRGLEAVRERSGSKREHTKYAFGPELEDLYILLKARDVWLTKYDITLPSTKSIIQWIGVLGKIPEFQETKTQALISKDYRIDENLLLRCQRQTALDDERIKMKYAPKLTCRQEPCSIVIGLPTAQKLFNLDPATALNFSIAYPSRIATRAAADSDDRDTTQVNQPGTRTPSQNTAPKVGHAQNQRDHEGWLINIGERTMAMAWLPQRLDTQYLALAVRSIKEQRTTAHHIPSQGPPAFTKSSGYPAAIQLWQITSRLGDSEKMRTLNMTAKPRLVKVFCTDFGDIRQLSWWTIDNDKSSDNIDSGKFGHVRNGWLSILYSDGKIRFICVGLLEIDTCVDSEYVHIGKAVFTIEPPPNTIFTALCIASPTDLVAGTADGSICLYNLAPLLANDTVTSPEPFMRLNTHSTYVMSITSARDSGLPHIIMSTSAAGEVVLTDLRCPDQDELHVHKARLPSRNLAYLPFTKSLLVAVNKSGNTEAKSSYATNLLSHNLRHFYTNTIIAFLPPLSGSATALAGSKFHPCVLVGNASGSVFAINYLRRVIPQGRSGSASAPDGYLQQLCGHTWRADESKVPSSTSSVIPDLGLYHGKDARLGVSRFQEGFRPEKASVTRDGPKRKISDVETGAEVIFEEEQAVCAIEWNPNAKFAGIVAIAWGSGILRIQDVSHDAQ